MAYTNELHKGKVASFVSNFFREVRKVVWPTVKLTFKNTWITLIAIFVVGVFVFIIDFGIINLFGFIMTISK